MPTHRATERPARLASRATALCTIALAVPLLAGCLPNLSNMDFDFRPEGISTRDTVRTADRPDPDPNGLITYESYQVAVARRGDTVASMAERLGIDPEELASFNGRTAEDALLPDEVLALPRRVTPAGSGTADIAAIASGAIAAAEAEAGQPSASTPAAPQVTVQDGAEPVRHRVDRGETAFSIARLYGVTVSALAEWNGLGPDLTVREGQFLLIPLILETVEAPSAAPAAPGDSVAPLPPSAATPLPEAVTAAVLPAPGFEAGTAPEATPVPAASETASAPQTNAPASAFIRPIQGETLRSFGGGNEGIDIAAAAGSPVRAAADGQVAAITQNTDQISILVLRHDDGLLTIYANVQDIGVARGDAVSQGQTIASVAPGDPSFLHFEVRRGMQALDPAEVLP